MFHLLPASGTPFLLIYAWLALRIGGQGWRDVGLRPPQRWRNAAILGVGGGVGYQMVSLYIVEPAIARFTGTLPDVHLFAPLVGDVRFLLLSLGVAWTLAAFGEEMVYRGYLQHRLAELAGGRRGGLAFAILVASVLFGLAHLYQGVSGVLATGLSGAVFAALQLAGGGSLWVSILAHGAYDTVGFVLIFAGRYPGL